MVFTLRQRAERLRAVTKDLPGMFDRLARDATIRAVEKAAELTPTGMDKPAGTNMQTGHMKQSWATASQTQPQRRGGEHVTTLANDMEYASYVNDGHRMDRHFVPGLYIDNGVINYDPTAKVGIVVGTKTSYVPGLFMVDEAEEVYKKTVQREADRIVKEATK